MQNNRRKTIRQAVRLVTSGLVFVFLLLWGIDSQIIEASFENLENQQTEEDADRVKSAIKNAIGALGSIASDWAYWDDSYTFAEDHNHNYIQSNYPDPAQVSTESKVDLFVIFDRNDQILLYGNYHPELKKQIKLGFISDDAPAILSTLKPVFEKERPLDGLLCTDQGIILLVARPILDSQGQGISRGVLLMGRFLTKTMLEDISRSVNVRFDLVTNTDSRLTPSEREIFSRLISTSPKTQKIFYQGSLYQLYSDIKGQPVILLRSQARDDILKTGVKTRLLLNGLLVCIAIILLMSLAVYRARMKISQETLKASEERYRTLFANKHIVMLLIDPETANIVDANLASSAYYGWSIEELKGMKIHELNIGSKEELLEKMKRVFSDAQNHCLLKHRKADGSICDVEVYSGPLTVNGKVLLYSIVHDITIRKRAEEVLRDSHDCLQAILNSLDAIVYIADMKTHKLLFANEYCRKIFGNEIVGKPCWKVLQASEGPCSFCTNEKLLNDAGRPAGVYRWEFKNAVNQRWYDIADHAIQWIDGRIVRMEIATDITERKKAEASRIDYERQLQQAEKVESLGRMAGAVAHNYNNLLGVVLGNLELAMMEYGKVAGPAKYLDVAMGAANRASEIGKLMLAYLGQTTAKRKPLDLAATCRQYLTDLRGDLPEYITVHPSLPSPGPIVNGNAGQIKQILGNLFRNSQEAMSGTEGKISFLIKTVSRTEIPSDHRHPADFKTGTTDYACMEIIDKGRAISNDDIEKIFEPFFSTKFTGRGLGLPVVMGILKAHDGCVTVESEFGCGSIFRVFLPLATTISLDRLGSQENEITSEI